MLNRRRWEISRADPWNPVCLCFRAPVTLENGLWHVGGLYIGPGGDPSAQSIRAVDDIRKPFRRRFFRGQRFAVDGELTSGMAVKNPFIFQGGVLLQRIFEIPPRYEHRSINTYQRSSS